MPVWRESQRYRTASVSEWIRTQAALSVPQLGVPGFASHPGNRPSRNQDGVWRVLIPLATARGCNTRAT
jgi:hypothetical protein